MPGTSIPSRELRTSRTRHRRTPITRARGRPGARAGNGACEPHYRPGLPVAAFHLYGPGVVSYAWIDDFTPAHVRNLDIYQPGKPTEELERELGISGAIKVASNENPLGPSPKALAAIPAALSSLHFYPDAGGFALRRALSVRL